MEIKWILDFLEKKTIYTVDFIYIELFTMNI